jgi:hypothetical protein
MVEDALERKRGEGYDLIYRRLSPFGMQDFTCFLFDFD